MERVIFLVAGFFALFAGNITADTSTKYVLSNQNATFHDAFVRCHQYGLDPAEIVSEDDQKEVIALLQSTTDLNMEHGFWIFATNLGDKVSYWWLNSGRPLFYSAYGAGKPDNVNNTENCLEVYQTTSGHFAWNDLDCDTKLRFLCQYKPALTEACNNNMVADA